MGVGPNSKARIWMAHSSKRISLFLQDLNGTMNPSCWQSPGENGPAFQRGTAALGVSLCPKQSSLEDLHGAGLHLTCTFRGSVIDHYPSYHPLARELKLRVERVQGLP